VHNNALSYTLHSDSTLYRYLVPHAAIDQLRPQSPIAKSILSALPDKSNDMWILKVHVTVGFVYQIVSYRSCQHQHEVRTGPQTKLCTQLYGYTYTSVLFNFA
jgi:hypothetical protein